MYWIYFIAWEIFQLPNFWWAVELVKSHMHISGCWNNTAGTRQEGDCDIMVLAGRCYRWPTVLREGVGVVRPQEWACSAALGTVLLQQEGGSTYSSLCLYLQSTGYWNAPLAKYILELCTLCAVLFQVRHLSSTEFICYLSYDYNQEGLLPFSRFCFFESRWDKKKHIIKWS